MPGGFSGNGSMKWFVIVKQATPNSEPAGGGKHRHEGEEDVPKDSRFNIIIQMPQDPTERLAFRQQLYDAWDNSVSSSTKEVTLSIPVEDQGSGYPWDPKATGRKDQIVVDW